ncbi:DUF1800 domain-containing protein [Enterovibrio calviensis]|uniref:DUF1800 domain-containing protein n=1 Tax=Enterovibrio calviensis TaxID=91359 RepID=UPI000685CB0B|nr:DUF1800 domain-containing protein [Enterovibrio calviensis]
MVHDIEMSTAQSNRFLQRATFGPKVGDVDVLMSQGIRAWFDEQVDRPVSLHLPLAIEYTPTYEEKSQVTETGHYGAWWKHALHAEDQLRQRMAYALSQIFVVSDKGVAARRDVVVNYYDILVNNALGNFRTLMEEASLSLAMGLYLTMKDSKKANPALNTYPDENYAREIMQLFSLGLWELNINGTPVLNANGKRIPTYTQRDVSELARVFTGWVGVDPLKQMRAKTDNHDFGAKVVLGTQFDEGQSARKDMSLALDMLFEHHNTPPFISTLLIKRFVTSNPRPEYVERVARIFIDNGEGVRGDLKAVLFAILTDEDAVNQIGKGDSAIEQRQHFGSVKEPILAMAQISRGLGVDTTESVWRDFFRTERTFGQAPLAAASVFNFYTPDYAPRGEISEKGMTAPEFAIINAQTLHDTQQYIFELLLTPRGGYNNLTWDHSDYVTAASGNTASDNTALVELISDRFFCSAMRNSLKTRLEQALVEHSELHVTTKVKLSLYTALTSPEFFTQEAVA